MQNPRKVIKSSREGSTETSECSKTITRARNEVSDSSMLGETPALHRNDSLAKNCSQTSEKFSLDSDDPEGDKEVNIWDEYWLKEYPEFFSSEGKENKLDVRFVENQAQDKETPEDSHSCSLSIASPSNQPETNLTQTVESQTDKNSSKPTAEGQRKDLSPPCKENPGFDSGSKFEGQIAFLMSSISSKICPILKPNPKKKQKIQKPKNGKKTRNRVGKVLDLRYKIPLAKLLCAIRMDGLSKEKPIYREVRRILRKLEEQANEENKLQRYCFTIDISPKKVEYLIETGFGCNSELPNQALYSKNQKILDSFNNKDTSIIASLETQSRSRNWIEPKVDNIQGCLARFSSSELNGGLAGKYLFVVYRRVIDLVYQPNWPELREDKVPRLDAVIRGEFRESLRWRGVLKLDAGSPQRKKPGRRAKRKEVKTASKKKEIPSLGKKNSLLEENPALSQVSQLVIDGKLEIFRQDKNIDFFDFNLGIDSSFKLEAEELPREGTQSSKMVQMEIDSLIKFSKIKRNCVSPEKADIIERAFLSKEEHTDLNLGKRFVDFDEAHTKDLETSAEISRRRKRTDPSIFLKEPFDSTYDFLF